MKPLFFKIGVLLCLIPLIHCGDGGSGGPRPIPDTIDPGESVDPNASFNSLIKNTFPNKEVEVNPTFLDMGRADKDKPLLKNLQIINHYKPEGTVNKLQIQLQFIDTSGQFSVVESDGKIASNKILNLEKDQSADLKLRYAANQIGSHTGLLKITADGFDPDRFFIQFPLRAQVENGKELRVIASHFFCNDKEAPTLDRLDFLRVATGRTKKLSFKICNTTGQTVEKEAQDETGKKITRKEIEGGKIIRISSLRLASFQGSQQSQTTEKNIFEGFLWDVNDQLNAAFFSYSAIPADPVFSPPQEIPYNGPTPVVESAYSWKIYDSDQQPIDSKVISINPKKQVKIEVEFKPNLESSPPLGQLYQAFPFSKTLQLSTDEGVSNVDLVGASGGREPIIKIIPGLVGTLPAACDTKGLDLDAELGAIWFDQKASIYNNWIPEDDKDLPIRLCNDGALAMDIWLENMEPGFFTLAEDAPSKFPIRIAPGDSHILTLRYSPTPSDEQFHQNWDFGQLVLNHTGGNGPKVPLVLVGEQEEAEIIEVTQENGSIIKKHNPNKPPYTESKRKNMQCAKIGDGNGSAKTTKKILVKNNSKNTLTAELSLASPILSPTNASGTTSLTNARVQLSQPNLSILPKEEASFDLIFEMPAGIEKGSILNGKFTIKNQIIDARTNKSPPEYQVFFKITAAESEQCTGGGSGQPLDNTVTMIIDRITMILPGGLPEPARNPPSFKFHLPIDLRRNNGVQGWARVHDLSYDPSNSSISPIQQIRSYAHQITSVTGCFPLPTNPYKLEYEKGSWDGLGKTCNPHKPASQPWEVEWGSVCIQNNGTQEATDPATGEKVDVFYHEFVKSDPDSCAVEYEGKISTFFIKKNEHPRDVFRRMIDEVGSQGTEEDYAGYTRPYSFDSYILFNKAYNKEGCNYPAGTRLEGKEDPAAIRSCWQAFLKDKDQMRRYRGMIEECSYFQFEIEEGCVPKDAPGASNLSRELLCDDTVSYSNKDSWKGFGEYEPDPDDDEKYHLTIRNIHISAFTLVHSLNLFFESATNLLFSDLYVTLTTKAVGQGEDWQDLIAPRSRDDFVIKKVRLPFGEGTDAKKQWVDSGVNNQFSVGEDDADICDPQTNPTKCRGNYIFDNGNLLHSGEAIDLSTDKNRLLLSGLASFHGKGKTAPSFAAEEGDGTGKPLYFTFHGCLMETPNPRAGCYDFHLDDPQNINDYINLGILEPSDKEATNEASKARVNFVIFDEDRQRMTDYYRFPNNYRFKGYSPVKEPCGIGH